MKKDKNYNYSKYIKNDNEKGLTSKQINKLKCDTFKVDTDKVEELPDSSGKKKLHIATEED